jgi:hypothetical protein
VNALSGTALADAELGGVAAAFDDPVGAVVEPRAFVWAVSTFEAGVKSTGVRVLEIAEAGPDEEDDTEDAAVVLADALAWM